MHEHEHQRKWAQTLRNHGPQKQDKRHATRGEAEPCVKALLGKGQRLSAQPAEHPFPEKDFPGTGKKPIASWPLVLYALNENIFKHVK